MFSNLGSNKTFAGGFLSKFYKDSPMVSPGGTYSDVDDSLKYKGNFKEPFELNPDTDANILHWFVITQFKNTMVDTMKNEVQDQC